MLKSANSRIKFALMIIGAYLSNRILHGLQLILYYIRLGRWYRERGYWPVHRVGTRRKVFEFAASRASGKRVAYLEFGVFEGASLRTWASLLKNPTDRLVGFDSFEGLPEDFDVIGTYQAGSFDKQGRLPVINDSRVSFVKGWFNETLPKFTVPEHDLLIVALDADLYTSTMVVLQNLKNSILPGTLVYMDEMSRLEHEPKALDDFKRETGMNFKLLCTDDSGNCALFERI